MNRVMSSCATGTDPRLQAGIAAYLAAREQGPVDSRIWRDEFADVGSPLEAWIADYERVYGAFGTDTASPLPDLLPVPSELGDFTLESVVGWGGMGVVYKARQRSPDRVVALKVIRGDRLHKLTATSRREWLERFRREINAAAKLGDHEYLVTIYEASLTNDRAFYSMQFVEGPSLAEILAQGPLPPRVAAECLERVSLAVFHAHKHRILHCDIKPHNILLCGDPRKPLVVDFGLAHLMGLDSSGPTNGFGTPGYMAPEQLPSSPQVVELSWATDVFGLGATLFHAITGHRPPTVEQPAAEDNSTWCRTITRSLQQAGVDSELAAICRKCLAWSPLERYESADAVARELRRYLEYRPVEAVRSGALRRARFWVLRNPLVTVAVGLFLLGAGAFVAHQEHSKRQLRRAHDRALQAEEIADQHRATALLALESILENASTVRDTIDGERAFVELVRDARQLLRQLETDASENQATHREMELHYRLGGIFARVGTVDGVGGLPETAAQFRRTQSIADELIARQEHVAKARYRRAQCDYWLGDIHLQSGKLDEAATSFERARRQFEELSTSGQYPRLSVDFANAERGLASAELRRGRSANAVQLLRSASGRIKEHLEQSSRDVEARVSLALCHENLARALERAGAIDDAIETARLVVAERTELVRQRPSNSRFRRDQHISELLLGDMMLLQGDPVAARRVYESSLKELLAKGDKSNVTGQQRNDIAVALQRLGDAARDKGQVSAAREAYAKAVLLLEEMTSDDPANMPAQSNLAVILGRLAQTHNQLGEADAARTAAQRAVDIRTRLAASSTDDEEISNGLGQSHYLLADVLHSQGLTSKAKEHAARATAIFQRWSDRATADYHAAKSLARAMRLWGATLSALGDFDTAILRLREALEQVSRLNELRPDASDARELVALVQNSLGTTYEAKDDRAAATECHGRAVEAMNGLLATESKNVQQLRNGIVVYLQAADWARRTSRVKEARELVQRAEQLARAISDLDPSNEDAQRLWTSTLLRQAKVAGDQGDWNAAIELANESLALRERQLRERPTSDVAQRDEAMALAFLGMAYFETGRLKEAEEFIQRGLSARGRLARSSVNNADLQREWAYSLRELGDLRNKQNNSGAAVAAYRQAATGLENVVASQSTVASDRTELLLILSRLARASKSAGRLAEELNARDKTVEHWNEAIRVSQTPDIHRRELALEHEARAIARRNAGAFQKAIADLRETLRLYDQLPADLARDAKTLRARTAAYHQLACVYWEQYKLDDARQAWHQAQAHLETWQAAQPQDEGQEAKQWSETFARRLAECDLAERATKELAIAEEHHDDIPLILIARVAILARQGQMEAAIETAERIASLANSEERDLCFLAARSFAVCAAQVRDSDTNACEKYSRRALELLRRAEQEGLFKNNIRAVRLRQHEDLRVLRDRDDFQDWLDAVATK